MCSDRIHYELINLLRTVACWRALTQNASARLKYNKPNKPRGMHSTQTTTPSVASFSGSLCQGVRVPLNFKAQEPQEAYSERAYMRSAFQSPAHLFGRAQSVFTHNTTRSSGTRQNIHPIHLRWGAGSARQDWAGDLAPTDLQNVPANGSAVSTPLPIKLLSLASPSRHLKRVKSGCSDALKPDKQAWLELQNE